MATQQAPRLSLAQFSTRNEAMQRCLLLAAEAAKSELPILLLGETGTGKTLLARAIHDSSVRADAAFTSFNASAMSENLLESQLFGHEKGAFTGADRRVLGKFEQADGGTLFFDEIADMSLLAQAKILRAAEYGEFERLGSNESRHADVRLISATHKPMRRLIREGGFREDLYYRLSGLRIQIPPLRDRAEDLPALIATELRACAERAGKEIVGIAPDAFDMLLDYPWPGNLRELHRVMQTAVLFASDGEVHRDAILLEDMSDLEPLVPSAEMGAAGPSGPAGAAVPPGTLGEGAGGGVGRIANDRNAVEGYACPDADHAMATAERRHILYVLACHRGDKRKTVKALGISRATLDRKLKAYREAGLYVEEWPRRHNPPLSSK